MTFRTSHDLLFYTNITFSDGVLNSFQTRFLGNCAVLRRQYITLQQQKFILIMSSKETEGNDSGIGEAERERLVNIRRQHEALKSALLAKKAAREISCICCMEAGDKWHMAKLPCEHM
jgi:hypothetical protein